MSPAPALPATRSVPQPAATPEAVLPAYERAAEFYAKLRDRSLYERRWLDRALGYAPGREVLDLGCGPGLPLAAYLSDRRCAVTGVDAAPSMLALFRENLPRATAVEADMRGLSIGERFDMILAWDSLFHLSPEDQRAMFATFAAHAQPRAVLLFTTGSSTGEAVGKLGHAPLYHASLAPEEYRALLEEVGFGLIAFTPEDPDCALHTVWLARFRGD